MTAVLVHGVPETAALWDPLVAALDRDDVAALALPGFGCPLPDGFEPTMHVYADWLAGELAGFDEVDLVAHDWGALLALRVLADQPANVRSWAVDAGDLADDHRWHDTALVLQTPGEGEALIEALVSLPDEDRVAALVGLGVPVEAAPALVDGIDATMGVAVLGLYRSATRIGIEWGPGIDRFQGPGLVVESGRDPYRSPGLAHRLAERTGAEVLDLPEAGHWWMLEDPVGIARALEGFWASA